MKKTRALVFDTNFIIQNHDLEEVQKNLSEKGFSVYVTQVAINERIAQECIKQKEKYDKLEKIKEEAKRIASITINITYDEKKEVITTGMNLKYKKLFNKNIISYKSNAKMFERILERSYMKTPPFITAKTDKGFKDCLMWLSMLDYFSEHGEEEVVFLSNDNGFVENSIELCREFEQQTSKTIKIDNNSYYKELLESNSSKNISLPQEKMPDLNLMRERIQNTLENICYVETEDYFGQEIWRQTFTTSKIFDLEYMEIIFNNLYENISKHIFEQSVLASDILELDDRILDGEEKIPLTALEQLMNIYDEVKNKYPDFIMQLYSTSANLLNRNYVDAEETDYNGELPF